MFGTGGGTGGTAWSIIPTSLAELALPILQQDALGKLLALLQLRDPRAELGELLLLVAASRRRTAGPAGQRVAERSAQDPGDGPGRHRGQDDEEHLVRAHSLGPDLSGLRSLGEQPLREVHAFVQLRHIGAERIDLGQQLGVLGRAGRHDP